MTPTQIKATRLALGLSYREFAALIGLEGANSHISVWRWETGRRTPSPVVVKVIEGLVPKK